MAIRVNMDVPAAAETTAKTEISEQKEQKVKTESNPVPMVENTEADPNKGLAVEHSEESEVQLDENAQQAKKAEREKELAAIADAKSQSKRGLKINMDESGTPDAPKTTTSQPDKANPGTNNAESAEHKEDVAAEPEDENLAAINKRLEAQQKQIEEQNRIIAKLRADAKAKAEADAKAKAEAEAKAKAEAEAQAKAIAEAQRQAELDAAKKVAAAEAKANDAIIAANKAIIESAGVNPEGVKPEGEVTNDKPVEEGRPRPEKGYEYLMDLDTKELKKLARSKDEAVARNAKLELEGRKHDRNIYTAPELSDNERSLVDAAVEASGVDKPFYKNRKAQKLLRKQLRDKSDDVVAALDKKIEEAKTEEEKQALQVFRDALDDKNLSRKYARTVVKDLKIGDRVEHTVVVDSYKDKKEAKQKLGDEAGDFRIKRHSKAFMKHNAEVKAQMEEKGISSHQAVYEQISGSEEDPRRISGDRTFETSEVTTTASYASDDKTRYNAARRELKRLGYKVDDGMAKKVLMPIIAALATAGGAGAGILYTGGLSTIVEATATALAEASVIIPELGINVAESVTSKASVNVKINNWQNSLISAGVATLIASTMFGTPDEEVDLLRNHDRCDLFRDVPDGNGGTTRAFEQASFGNKHKTKATKAILREIDKLELSDEQKVALLNKAAGDKGLGKLTAKELILAYIHGMDMVAGAEKTVKPDKSCQTCEEEKVEEEKPCPCEEEEEIEEEKEVATDKDRIKYETEDVEGTKTRTIATIQYGGPYHYAQFYVVDGKPIKYNSPEYKAIIAKLNDGAMKETNNRKDRVLLEEIDLGNGKTAKLLDDAKIAEIRARMKTKKGGKDVRYTSVTTKDGYTVLYKVDKDGVRTELERGAKQAMENKRDSLNRVEEEKMKE